MNAEFEEKDFEAPLYNELKFGMHRIATPGQVFEGSFGIDAALEAEHPLFWDLFGYYDVPKGIVLNDFNWGFVWKKLGKMRRLPTFRTNVLIQSKRPKVLRRVRKELKSYGFKGKYWRYDITPHQQAILEKISNRLKRKALVIYAAPAFDTLDELYDFTEAQKVVERSNFVRVENLRDHGQWNYREAGTSGLALSEPEFIEDEPFYSLLMQLGRYDESDLSASDNLSFLHESALHSCKEVSETNAVARYYLRIHNRLMRMGEFYEYEETIDYMAFNLFCNVVNLKWLVTD